MLKKFSHLISKHPLSAIILVTLIFATSVLVIVALNIKSTTKVEILVTPESSEITINGKTYQNGTFDLPVGKLSVSIKKSGFETQEFTFDSATSNKIYTYLLQSDGTYSWYDEHPEDSSIMTTISDYQADQTAASYTEKNPLIDKLPIVIAEYDQEYNYTEYRIDGGKFDGCKTDFCLKVTDTTGGNLDAAKEQIKSIGYNPDNYQIIYEYVPIIPLE